MQFTPDEVDEIKGYFALHQDPFDGYAVPPHMHRPFIYYVLHQYEPGSFGYAMLCGHYDIALGRADQANQMNIDEIGRWIEERLPKEIHGSPEAVRKWLTSKGTL